MLLKLVSWTDWINNIVGNLHSFIVTRSVFGKTSFLCMWRSWGLTIWYNKKKILWTFWNKWSFFIKKKSVPEISQSNIYRVTATALLEGGGGVNHTSGHDSATSYCVSCSWEGQYSKWPHQAQLWHTWALNWFLFLDFLLLWPLILVLTPEFGSIIYFFKSHIFSAHWDLLFLALKF